MVERTGGKLLGLARVVERGRVEKIMEKIPSCYLEEVEGAGGSGEREMVVLKEA